MYGIAHPRDSGARVFLAYLTVLVSKIAYGQEYRTRIRWALSILSSFNIAF